MRKAVLLGGLLVTVGGFTGHAAIDAWADRYGAAQLEELRRRLPPGATLSWASLDVEPWQRSVRLTDLRLDLPASGVVGGAGIVAGRTGIEQLAVGEVVLTAAGPNPLGGLDTLGRARLADVTVALADGGTLHADVVVGDEVDVRTLREALASPGGLLGLADARLGALDVEKLVWTSDADKLEVERLGWRGYAQRRLEGLRLHGIRLGGADPGSLSLDDLALESVDGAGVNWPEVAELLESDPVAALAALAPFELRGLTLGGVNFADDQATLALTSFGVQRLGQGRLEGVLIEQLGATSPSDGGRFAVQHLSLGYLDWQAIDLARLAQAAAMLEASEPDDAAVDGEPGAEDEATTDDEAMPEDEVTGDEPAGDDETAGTDTEEDEATDEADATEPPSDESAAEDGPADIEQSFAGLELMAQLMRLKGGELRVEGLSGGDREGHFTLGSFRVGGFEPGRFGGSVMRNLVADVTGKGRLSIEEASSDPVTFPPVDLEAKLETVPRTEEALAALIMDLWAGTWRGHSMLRNLRMETNGRPFLGLARIETTMSEEGPRKRTVVTFDQIFADLPALDQDGSTAVLQAFGIERLLLNVVLDLAYDTEQRAIELDRLGLDAPGIAALDTRFKLTLGGDPVVDPMVAMTETALVAAELTYRDAGLVDRLLQQMERDTRRKRADIVKDLLAQARTLEIGRLVLTPQRAQQVETFLRKPRTLVVALRPKEPMALSNLAMGAIAAPQLFVQAAGIEIKALDR